MIFGFYCVLITLTTLLYIYSKICYNYWKKRKIITYPGASLPFGNLKNIFSPKATSVGLQLQAFYDYFKQNGVKHGGIYMFQRPVFVPVDLDLIKSIMTKDYNHFEEKGMYYNEKNQPIDANLFTIGGERWKNLRIKLTPTFTSGKLKTMHKTMMDCSVPLINKISEYIDRDLSFNMKEMCASFTTDVVGTCAFGIECNSFKTPNSEFRLYGKQITSDLPLIIKLKMPFLQAFPNLSLWLGLRSFSKKIEMFYTGITTETVHYRLENDIKRNDLLQMMIDLMHKQEFDMQEIVNQAFIFFIAGFETSSSTMSNLMIELCHNLELQDKVREEINKTLKKHNNELSYECINDMKYLDQCFHETLRKYPAAPLLNRQCTKPYPIPGSDLVLDKGTLVFIPLMGIHKDPEYYPDPEKFDPDRFSEENKRTRHSYSWIPFGEGPRICIGQRFGMLQAKIGIIQLLIRYRFVFAKKIQYPILLKNAFLVVAAEDIILKATRL